MLRFGPVGWTIVCVAALTTGQPLGPSILGGAIGYAIIYREWIFEVLDDIGDRRKRGRRTETQAIAGSYLARDRALAAGQGAEAAEFDGILRSYGPCQRRRGRRKLRSLNVD